MTEIATQDVARSRAAMIRAGIQNYLSTLANVAAAYAQRDWKALGYQSWEAYVDGEYGAERLRLSPEHRQKAVAELRLAGMSQRAIGSALGVGQSTVRDDLTQLSGSTQLPDSIVGIDGRERPASRPDSPAGPMALSVSATEPDRSGHLPPAATGEADAQLDAAVPAAVREAPSGAPAPDGAGDDSTGDDLGSVDAQESAWAPSAAPGSDGQTSEPGVPDPLNDREALAEQHRERSSAAVAEALVAIRMRLEPDPIRWLRETWKPGGYRLRDMPRVRDCFTPEGLRQSAKYLEALADHLDKNGETL